MNPSKALTDLLNEWTSLHALRIAPANETLQHIRSVMTERMPAATIQATFTGRLNALNLVLELIDQQDPKVVQPYLAFNRQMALRLFLEQASDDATVLYGLRQVTHFENNLHLDTGIEECAVALAEGRRLNLLDRYIEEISQNNAFVNGTLALFHVYKFTRDPAYLSPLRQRLEQDLYKMRQEAGPQVTDLASPSNDNRSGSSEDFSEFDGGHEILTHPMNFAMIWAISDDRADLVEHRASLYRLSEPELQITLWYDLFEQTHEPIDALTALRLLEKISKEDVPDLLMMGVDTTLKALKNKYPYIDMSGSSTTWSADSLEGICAVLETLQPDIGTQFRKLIAEFRKKNTP